MAVDNDIRGDLRSEQNIDFKVTIEQIRKDLLDVDKLVNGVLIEWSEGREFAEIQTAIYLGVE